MIVADSFDPSRVRAVGFDGYGTLFDFTTPDFRQHVAMILATQGIELDLDRFYETWVRSYAKAGVWPPRSEGEMVATSDHALNGPLPDWHSQWEIWRRQFAFALEDHGAEGDPGAAADHLRKVLSHAAPYDDARATIDGLAERGLVLGLLSNADKDFLQSALSRARLRFSVIQSSESLRAYKPHRAMFLALCARFGVEPHEVLYVGDSPYADVNGARNAGLRAAWVRRDETAYPAERVGQPDLEIDALRDLLDLLGPEAA